MASAGLEKVLREVESLSEPEQRKLREVLDRRLTVASLFRDIDAPWVRPTLEGLARLSSLAPNWDSYGAAAIDSSQIHMAAGLLRTIMRSDTPPPAVVPTASGGLQLEWHESDVDLEIEVRGEAEAHVSFEDHRHRTAWEGELPIRANQFAQYIERLSG